MATDSKLPRGRMGAESIDKALRQAGSNLHTVIMDYESPSGETKTYELEPYSYRNGGMKFFGFDKLAKCIKGFDTTRIIRVEETQKTFKAQWPVELEVIS
jgi:predicted DNA-binding transcriptional regulator YafY